MIPLVHVHQHHHTVIQQFNEMGLQPGEKTKKQPWWKAVSPACSPHDAASASNKMANCEITL